MRKILIALMMITCLLSISLIMPVFAEETYTFGFGEEDFGQDENGKDGFFLMFVQANNTNGTYDVTQIKDCIWGTNSTFAMYVKGRRMWCPSIKQSQTGEFKDDAMWWRIGKEGNLMPSNGLSCVVRWEAPSDGKYNVHTVLNAGLSQAFFDHQIEYGAFPTTLDMDGVTCSIYQGSEKLFSKNSLILVDGKVDADKNLFTNNDLKAPEQNVELRKGESLYFITDQNAKADYDNSNWKITITKTGDLPAPTTNETTTAATTASTSASTTAATSKETTASSTTVGSTTETTTASSSVDASSDSSTGQSGGDAETSTDASSETSTAEVSSDSSSPDATTGSDSAGSFQETSTNATSVDAASASGDTKPSFPMVPVIVGAVVILAAAILYIVMKKKKA